MKMVLKNSKVEKYRVRLKNVTALLMLSQQCHIRALVESQHDIMSKKLALGSIKAEDPCLKPQVTVSRSRDVRNLKRKNSVRDRDIAFAWRLQASWISKKAFELSGLRAPDGWKIVFRIYNNISLESEAIRCVGVGDVEALQELFVTRKASPFDRVEFNGYSLLHYVGPNNSEATFRFLLDQGADPELEGHSCFNITPLAMLVWSGNLGFGGKMLPLLRLLLAHMQTLVYDTPEETIDSLLCHFYGTAEEFRFLQQECCPTYYEMPSRTRIIVATRITSGVWDATHMPDLVRAVLGNEIGSLNAEELQYECFENGYTGKLTLLHCIAMKIGKSVAELQQNERLKNLRTRPNIKGTECLGLSSRYTRRYELRPPVLTYDSWMAIFCEILGRGVDIHKIAGRSTVFSMFFSGLFDWHVAAETTIAYVDNALRFWLKDLPNPAIDLQKFGQLEQGSWKAGHINKNCNAHRGYRFSRGFRLIGFTYGPSPDDWKCWISDSSELWARDFWDLVAHGEDVVIGAWPEDLPYTS